MREVVRAVLGGIPPHSTVVKLLDPLSRAREPSSDRDSKRRETAVFDISGRRLGEGVNVADETGFKKLNRLFMVIQLFLVLRFFGSKVLVISVGAGFGGDNQSVNDGSVGVGREVVAGDCATD